VIGLCFELCESCKEDLPKLVWPLDRVLSRTFTETALNETVGQEYYYTLFCRTRSDGRDDIFQAISQSVLLNQIKLGIYRFRAWDNSLN
jgi:hypothetical protein